MKFRIWNIDEKKWMKMFILSEEDLNDCFNNTDYIFQQFTGKRDKNNNSHYGQNIFINIFNITS